MILEKVTQYFLKLTISAQNTIWLSETVNSKTLNKYIK